MRLIRATLQIEIVSDLRLRFAHLFIFMSFLLFPLILTQCEKTVNDPEQIPDRVFETDTLIDIDGNHYLTVMIDGKWWMKENLKVEHYQNGDPIENVLSLSQWGSLTMTTGAWCFNAADYTDESDIYGYLYNWYAVADPRNIAPEGWHVATDQDWKNLEQYVGMSRRESDQAGGRGTDQGKRLMSTDGWYKGEGSDEVGFTALPGGQRSAWGYYARSGMHGLFWTATAIDSSFAWNRYFYSKYDNIYRNSIYKRNGKSVRCVQD